MYKIRDVLSYVFIILLCLISILACTKKHNSATNSDTNPTSTLVLSATISPIVSATPTATITPTLQITDVSALITKTCFSVNTSTCGSATSAIVQDADGNIWASEESACAYFVKYDSSGNSLFSTTAPMIDGMAVDKTNNWLWYSTVTSGYAAYFKAYDSNDITGTAKASFNKPITTENYFRIAYDGTNMWVLYLDTSYNWQCVKYSTTGTSLGGFSVQQPYNGGYYWGITYGGDGYLWLSSYDNTNGYIYKMSTSGTIDAIYLLGSSLKTFGIDWVATNTFWVASQTQACKISF